MAKKLLTKKEIGSIIRASWKRMNDEGKHWIQHAYARGNKRCAVGAIRSECNARGLGRTAAGEVVSAFLSELKSNKTNGGRWYGVEQWNDRKGRTWDQVKAEFIRIGKRYR